VLFSQFGQELCVIKKGVGDLQVFQKWCKLFLDHSICDGPLLDWQRMKSVDQLSQELQDALFNRFVLIFFLVFEIPAERITS